MPENNFDDFHGQDGSHMNQDQSRELQGDEHQ